MEFEDLIAASFSVVVTGGVVMVVLFSAITSFNDSLGVLQITGVYCLQIHVNFLNTFDKLCDPSSFEIVPLPCAACSIQAIFWYIHCTTQIPTTMVIAAASHKSRSSHTVCWTFSRGNRTNFKSIIGYLCKQKDTVAHI